MTREEEICENSYILDGIDNIQDWRYGARWADQHPRKGLWDSEKVISFLKEHATVENSSNINIYISGACYQFVNDFIQDLREAMEEKQ